MDSEKNALEKCNFTSTRFISLHQLSTEAFHYEVLSMFNESADRLLSRWQCEIFVDIIMTSSKYILYFTKSRDKMIGR